MMERAQQKQEEKRQYWQAVTEVSRTCEDAAKADIRDFEARKKKVQQSVPRYTFELVTDGISPSDHARTGGSRGNTGELRPSPRSV